MLPLATAFAAIIEAADAPGPRRALNRGLLVAALFAILAMRIGRYFGIGAMPRHDFLAFYLAARLTLAGDIARAYDQASFMAAERALTGTGLHLAWNYPPPFDVMIAPLALLPLPWAFALFMTAGLVAYLLVLRRVAGAAFGTALTLAFVPIYEVMVFGQNGLVTGALVGLAGFGLARGRRWAGVPLGLMIIKPHLALGLAALVVLRRDWAIFGVAAATVIAACLMATLLLGPGVWPAFLAGMGQAGAMLDDGRFPLFRMVSPFATLRSWGMPTTPALLVQGLSAVAALAAVVMVRRAAPAHAVGIATLAGLAISPYVYDYDMTILVIGLAPLLAAARRDRPGARALLYAGVLILCGNAMVRVWLASAGAGPLHTQTLNAVWLALVLGLAVRIARRQPQPRLQ